ncbi:hypothetical protein PHMEG_00033585, partial [Phytophthora megakarya]
PGTDTKKNHEQATPASAKDNVSVRGTDTAKTHAQAGLVAPTSDVSMPGIDTEKLHAQAGSVAITHEVSEPGTDTTKSHAQSGADANTSGGSVQGTVADKVNELDPGFSSQAMDFVRQFSGFGASLLAPRLIGPFTVAERHGNAYTLELPSDTRIHPTFYVGRLKPYVQPESSSRDDSPTTTRSASSASPQAFHLLPEKANLFRHLNTDV